MTRVDLSDSLAAEMDKVLNSEETKQMFSSSSVLEKLAFSRVADEGKVPSEIEDELAKQGLLKTASSSCKCDKKHGSDEKCDCPKDCKCRGSKSASEIVSTLLKVSEDLEEAGFDKLAALSIVLTEKLVAQAKDKAKSKSESKSSKKDEKASKSKSSKKMTMKERMEKMRKMQKGKKGKKSSKKSALEVNLQKKGQDAHPLIPTQLKPDAPKPRLNEADTVMGALPANLKSVKVTQTGPDAFSVAPGQAVPAVTKVVQQLQQNGQLPWQKKYHVVPA